jgi:hypothetical protein
MCVYISPFVCNCILFLLTLPQIWGNSYIIGFGWLWYDYLMLPRRGVCGFTLFTHLYNDLTRTVHIPGKYKALG